jgi:HEAT repeats/Putative zinc-finger
VTRRFAICGGMVVEIMTCKMLQETLDLYFYSELPASEREAVEKHLAACVACQQRAASARKLHELMSRRSESDPEPQILVRCREALEEALDREQHGWRYLFRQWVSLPSGIHPSRVVTVLTLVVFGFGLGWMLRPRLHQTVLPTIAGSGATPTYNGADLGRISSISQVDPNPQTGQVRITLNAERRVTLEGSLDDPRIRQVLVYAVKKYDNTGIRLDTLSALKNGSGHPAVREALLYALLHDPNAGVRLEALKTVQQMGWDAEVRGALLQAVRRDANPGVRVTAIDELVNHALKDRDRQLVPVLQSLSSTDSNSYVRLKALAALHELGPEQ